MRILMVLTYFQPYKSGLTVYAVRQAQALAALGHQVTILTSQHDPALLLEESDGGVHIVRLPVLFRLTKGVIMPKLPFKLWLLMRDADLVNLHVPQFEAGMISVLAKLKRKPVVITYHCDLEMPTGWLNKLAGWVTHLMHRLSAAMADVIVHNTKDYAEHSSFLNHYLDKVAVIQPPVINAPFSDEDMLKFREKYKITSEQRIIGMVARLATEKGVEYLVQAMPKILASIPNVRVIFVGAYKNVPGEERYQQKLLPMIETLGDHWTFLGVVSEEEKSAFYAACDVLALPSINRTESFGMVQVEAILCGTPVVATDLPGVRQPIQETGLGIIVPVKDVSALADAIMDVLSMKMAVRPDVLAHLNRFYAPDTVARAYEAVYQDVLRVHG